MTQELRKLAEAAKGWLIRPSIVQETADDILKLGHTSEDGEFYELIEIDCENYDQPSRPLAEFIAAANPAAILSLLDRVEKAEKDAERWRNLCDLVNDDRASVTFYGRLDTINTGLAVHESGDLHDELDIAMEASK